MNDPKRLHPVYLAFSLVKLVRGLFPIFVVASVGAFRKGLPHWGWTVGFAAIFILAVVFGILQWKRFVYLLEEDKLVIRRGVFLRDEKSLYIGRIHSIQTHQPLLQRLLGVVQVTLETPGGSTEADGILPAVSLAEAERLQQWYRKKGGLGAAVPLAVRQAGAPQPAGGDVDGVHPVEPFPLGQDGAFPAGPAAEAGPGMYSPPIVEAGEVLLRMSPADLLKAALTTLNLGVFVTFVVGLFSFADDVVPDDWYESFFDSLLTAMPGAATGLYLLLGGVLFAWALSALLFVNKYWGFTVRREDDRISVSHGLLERKKLLFSPGRVQAVRVKEGWLRQVLGFAQIEVHVVSALKQEKILLHPMISMRRLQDYLSAVVPAYLMSAVECRPPRRALTYYLRWSLLGAGAMCAVIVLLLPEIGWWSLILVPLSGLWGYWRFLDAGMALDGDQLTFRTRVLARTTWFVHRRKIVGMKRKGTVFQRRKDLISVSVYMMGDIRDISRGVSCLERRDGEAAWKWYSR